MAEPGIRWKTNRITPNPRMNSTPTSIFDPQTPLPVPRARRHVAAYKLAGVALGLALLAIGYGIGKLDDAPELAAKQATIVRLDALLMTSTPATYRELPCEPPLPCETPVLTRGSDAGVGR